MAGAEFCICNTFSSRVICATNSAARFSAGSSGLRQATFPVCCPNSTAAKAMNRTPQVRKAPLRIATTPFRSSPVLGRKCWQPVADSGQLRTGERKANSTAWTATAERFPPGPLVYAPNYRRYHVRNQGVAAGRVEKRQGGEFRMVYEEPPGKSVAGPLA